MTGRSIGEDDARGHRAQGADQELALGADVEEAGLEAEPHREAGQDVAAWRGRACR